MPEIYYAYCESPIGLVEIGGTLSAVLTVDFVDRPDGAGTGAVNPLLEKALLQVREYFAGTRRDFDLETELKGTPFQMKIWKALLAVPYGRTASYKEIAAAVGNPRAGRAVGGANRQNPVPLIIPCHRVIGSDGSMIGYGGKEGIWRKEWLLQHEREHLPKI